MSQLEKFRQDKDTFFKNDPNSPLEDEQKTTFHRLNYFPENPEWIFEVKLEILTKNKDISLPTSKGENRDISHSGQIRFQINEEEFILQIFGDSSSGYFLPFVDATSPQETYGGGRFLDPVEIQPGILLVDFNLAYNPYCAYNNRWSCIIPPPGNRLAVRIEAGEKNFHP
jgi:uncharacterized protein (DUF1684 family)